MGNTAAEMFFDQLQSIGSLKSFVPQKSVLTPTLIIRESSLKKGRKK
jgi:hypothetical protein